MDNITYCLPLKSTTMKCRISLVSEMLGEYILTGTWKWVKDYKSEEY